MIERGDEVYHRPSGETWVVKRSGDDSDGGFVEPAGWPPCRARAADCDLIAKGKHLDFLSGVSRSPPMIDAARLHQTAKEGQNDA